MRPSLSESLSPASLSHGTASEAAGEAAQTALRAALAQSAADVEAFLDRRLPSVAELADRADYAPIVDGMRYAIFAGGKRLRPFLVMQSAALYDVPQAQALQVGAALECLHTYSLVHDDLPCMDDDDLRRGQPTVHRKYDEATAVLVGDALLTQAFGFLAHPGTHEDGGVRASLVARLAAAGGHDGMIGGQGMDMAAPAADYGAADIIRLQAKKTGALFEFACEAGALLAGAAPGDRDALISFARDFGLAFQISDDLIDEIGDSETAGKTVGKDKEQGKATLISLNGLDWAKREVATLVARAEAALDRFDERADLLRALPHYLLGRTI